MMQPASIRFDDDDGKMQKIYPKRIRLQKSGLVSSRLVPSRYYLWSLAWLLSFLLKEAPFLPSLVVRALFARGRLRLDRRRGATRGRGQDGGEAVFRPLVARVGGSDVPFVRLQRVPAAADAHFCEVADGVFGFW